VESTSPAVPLGRLTPVRVSETRRSGRGERPSQLARIGGLVQRVAPKRGLIRSSAILFFGGTAARLIGFMFSVAAARLLLPADYGLLAYGLAIVGFASILISSAPAGLATFVARYQGNPHEQELHFSNWLAVITLLLALSSALMVPIAAVARLSAPMLLAVIANLIGLAVLQTYKEAQRGLERFAAMAIFYFLANVAQLVAILVLAAFGYRNPALFLAIYGLSSIAALAIVQPVAPLALRFVRDAVEWQRMMAVARYIQPLVLQTVFFAIWFGADLILVQRLLSSQAAGNYAAAKSLANAVYLAPSAVSGAVMSRIARTPEISLGGYLGRVLIFATVVTAPLLIIFVVFGKPLTGFIFGGRYGQVSTPLAVLAIGMAFYGVYLVLSGSWRGLGRPGIDAIATGVGTLATLVTGLLLVPRDGLLGAAVAFSLGAMVQLIVIGGYTVRQILSGRVSRLDDFMHRRGEK
jgi:O-antigen/teichoic acid export membrane protein